MAHMDVEVRGRTLPHLSESGGEGGKGMKDGAQGEGSGKVAEGVFDISGKEDVVRKTGSGGFDAVRHGFCACGEANAELMGARE